MSLLKFSSMASRNMRLSPLHAASHQAFTHSLRVKAGFVFAPHPRSNFVSFPQISVHLLASAQIVTKHRVNVRQHERRVLLRDFLGSTALGKRRHDRIER